MWAQILCGEVNRNHLKIGFDLLTAKIFDAFLNLLIIYMLYIFNYNMLKITDCKFI